MQENIQDNQENLSEAELFKRRVLEKKALQKRALEITCYVCGAGAFGVFFRWLQTMTAFDENGLVDRSAFNLLVPLLIIGSALLYDRFIKKMAEDRLYVPKEFCEALFNPGKIFTVIRWTACGAMCIGALLLVVTTELDKNADFLRVLAVLALAAGLVYPLYMGEANYEEVEHLGIIRIYGVVPILLYAVWLVLSYKENMYNSVVWDYVLEMVTIIVVINAFFRMAGFAFMQVNGRKTLFYCMLGTTLCIMSLADSRYIGQQLIFGATALMLAADNWILITNLKRKEPQKRSEIRRDGFERL